MPAVTGPAVLLTRTAHGTLIAPVPTIVFGDFEWDADKAAENVRKHGVDFEEAATVFTDLNYLLVADDADEDRFLALGFSRLARVLVVVHIERAQRMRIISARRASAYERRIYEQRARPD